MRLKFGHSGNRSDWKCCFCCHVRTGTICLGIWHLMIQILALAIITVVLRHPPMIDDPVLPTPLSEVDEPIVEIISPNLGPSIELSLKSEQLDDTRRPSSFASTSSYRDIFNYRSLKYRDLNVGLVVTFCTLIITLLMILGALKGKPSYLMPFFCLQVCDFCIATFTAVGYLCYLPDIRGLIAENPYLPFKEELLDLNAECLSLLVLFTFVFAMMVKAYFIGVVWSCYKYLNLRMVAAQRIIHYIDPDSQSMLPDLPDYDTAIGDPRFVMKKFPTPPPSYASAVNLAVETVQEPPYPSQIQTQQSSLAQAVNEHTSSALQSHAQEVELLHSGEENESGSNSTQDQEDSANSTASNLYDGNVVTQTTCQSNSISQTPDVDTTPTENAGNSWYENMMMAAQLKTKLPRAKLQVNSSEVEGSGKVKTEDAE